VLYFLCFHNSETTIIVCPVVVPTGSGQENVLNAYGKVI